MSDFNRTAPATHNEPVRTDDSPMDRPYGKPIRTPLAPRLPMTTTGPLFSSLDMAAGIFAAIMTLGPLAMVAFAVGRY